MGRSAEGAGALVGREAERMALERWTVEAWDGAMRVVTVSGDAGTGKTALVDAVVPEWGTSGAAVWSAVCHEDVAVPYLPLLTALPGSPDRTRATGDVDDGGVLGRTPELFVRAAEVLLEVASTRRVVLRVEDIHWADPATLDLLAHLLATASHHALGSPLTLLVVLVTRPDGDGPSVGLLERVARDPSHRRLPVGPLDELAVDQLLRTMLDGPPTRRLLTDVLDASEGNALFVHELVQHLRATASLVVEHGEVGSAGDVVPEQTSLSDVLTARIEGLDEVDQRVLTSAAYLGDGQRVDDLCHVLDMELRHLEQHLDRLETAGVLLERSDGRLVFPHSLIRQLLVRRVSRRARQDLHLRVAQRLIQLRPETDERLLRIAHHLRRAGPKAPPDLLLQYAERAARTSLTLAAWTKAARYAELALDARAAVGAGDDRHAIELHLLAALGHFRNHDRTATSTHAARAIDLAQHLGDLDAWGQALLIAHRAALTLHPDVTTQVDRHADLERFLDEAGDGVPMVRAQCWQLLSEIATSAGDMALAWSAAAEAKGLAAELSDPVLESQIAFAEGLAGFASLDPRRAVEAFEASVGAARAGDDDWVLAWPMGRLPLAHVLAGDLVGASRGVDAAMDLARRTHHWSEEGLARSGGAVIALAHGNLPSSERLAGLALQVHERSSYPFIAAVAWPVQAYGRALRLDRLGAVESIEHWRQSEVRGASRFSLLVDALTLPVEELRVVVDPSRYVASARSEPHVYGAGGLIVDVEVGTRLDDEEVLIDALRRLDDLRARGVELLLPIGASVDRLRAMATTALGNPSTAVALLDAACQRLEATGAVTEQLRCRAERCLALSALDDPSVRDEARTVAGELDAASLLAVLQRLREQLPDLPIAARLRRAVVVWDMVESTRHLVAVGDEAYVDLVHELNSLVHRRLSTHRGVAFKYTGDGVFAWFLDEADALRCAAGVAVDLRRRRARAPDDPLRLRTGIAAGQPVDDAGDLFGVAVVTAARLCAAADDGQVLCTAETTTVTAAAVPTRAVGSLALKGLAEPVDVVELILA
ncbi:MAG: AAA family ATPase [Acidimicrobiales bacterium]